MIQYLNGCRDSAFFEDRNLKHNSNNNNKWINSNEMIMIVNTQFFPG